MTEVKDLNREGQVPTWCPGCGNFGILSAEKMAISELNLDPKKIVEVSGIGCAALFPHWIKTNFYETLHGRTLPVASGIKLANRELTVIAHAGDGDCYGIGMGHFVHTARRNIDMTCVVHDNQIYALTKGQYSPTTPKGRASMTTPEGAIETPLNATAVSLSSDATFVARSFSNDPKHLKETLKKAIEHDGFSVVSVFQECVTYNRINNNDWWKERLYDLQEEGYKPDDKIKAYEKSKEWGDKIPMGVFYKEDKPTYESQIEQLENKEIVDKDLSNIDVTEVLKKKYV
ncbi:MAG: 2-oxoacid:ferredoxin oxidoreductase subunit beta [Candidatus Undinarchaeales archaeon]